MTHTEYGPLWVKRRMGAQVQFSCSFSQLWLSVLFTMNSKEFKPPSLSFGCLFLYFKDYPVSLKLQTHPRLGIQCRKKWAKFFLSAAPHFIAHLLLHSPMLTNSITHHISFLTFPQPLFFSILTRGLLIIF